jgi:hypothetical protein
VASRVTQGHRGLRVSKVFKDQLDLREQRGHRALGVLQALRVTKVTQAQRVTQVFKARRVFKEPRVSVA